MKHKSILRISLLALLIFVSSALDAQKLISAKELAKIINKDNVVVVSTRKSSDYARSHIKGAINIENKILYSNTTTGKLKSAGQMASILGKKGINKSKIVVIHCNGAFVGAGRLYFILKYLGVSDVRILNGHLVSWRAARKPLTKTPTTKKAVTFTPSVKSYMLTGSFSGGAIYDCREKADFDKKHVKSAKHFNNETLYNHKSKILKSKSALNSIFTAAGMSKTKPIILYCKTGARASAVYFALKYCGYTKVKIYNGYAG
ncbi:MAG: rhodanese-like domain-containing protein [Bacteroidota bacterium]|nr:rhodanese-like domain-containing protein [Bacteroidota bacterium]